jgi:hypothetical protein
MRLACVSRSIRMSTLATIRRAALSLPHTIEADHHGFPSFRVGGKIFATLPDETHLHILLEHDDVELAVSTDPEACEELHWGKTLAGVRVTIARARLPLVRTLLGIAWRRRAPKKLLRELDGA